MSGFWYGYSQFIRFAFIGIIFYISAVFVVKYKLPSDDVYIGVYVLFVAALGTGIVLSSAPSVGKAQAAATNIFAIVDEPS